MGKYLAKRVVSIVVSLFLLATVTFFMMHAVPGSPFTKEGKTSPQIEEKLNEKYHLNEPVIVQYQYYLKDLVHLDLGPSIKYENMSVNELISLGFPVSAKLGLIAVGLVVIIGIPVGVLAALKRGKVWDKIVLIFSTVGIAVPSFVLATLLLYVFATKLKLFPMYGVTDPKGYILPAIAMAGLSMATITRMTRSSLLDILSQDYMVTAKAKGLSGFRIFFIHALKNALIPIVTVLGPTIATLLTGTFIIEKIFAIPGMGRYFVESISSRDYTVIMGITIFYALILNIMILLVDIIYVLIDPRIKLGNKG